MSELTIEQLEKRLNDLLGDDVPEQATQDVNVALQVAEIVKSKGFSFQMEDLCRRSMDDCMWRVVYSKDGVEFSADDPRAAVAVCSALVKALDSI
ncbi:hypothetical protein [Maridesulfovibrio frigidus]|uniref:hypothetical protein n=1 Tax=Maridesulfovibrio frigidus TaxID=340956 RepID=UPI0004E1EF1D|nr:hypothetical protein [Maridesulfovibrio frigidus]